MKLTHNLVKHRMLQTDLLRPFVPAFAEAYHRIGNIGFALEEVLPDYVPGKDIIKLLDPAMTHKHEKFVDYFWCSKNWDDLDWFKFHVEIDGHSGLVTAEHHRDNDKFFVTWREWFGGDNFGENKRVWISGHDTVQLIKETGDIYGMAEELK